MITSTKNEKFSRSTCGSTQHWYKSNLQIQCDLYQNTNVIFHRTETNNLKYFLETQKTPTSKNLRKKNIAGEIMLPDFILYYKVTVFNSKFLSQTQIHRSTEPSREPEMNPHLHEQLIYDKGGKNIQRRKYSFSNKYY